MPWACWNNVACSWILGGRCRILTVSAQPSQNSPHLRESQLDTNGCCVHLRRPMTQLIPLRACGILSMYDCADDVAIAALNFKAVRSPSLQTSTKVGPARQPNIATTATTTLLQILVPHRTDSSANIHLSCVNGCVEG